MAGLHTMARRKLGLGANSKSGAQNPKQIQIIKIQIKPAGRSAG